MWKLKMLLVKMMVIGWICLLTFKRNRDNTLRFCKGLYSKTKWEQIPSFLPAFYTTITFFHFLKNQTLFAPLSVCQKFYGIFFEITNRGKKTVQPTICGSMQWKNLLSNKEFKCLRARRCYWWFGCEQQPIRWIWWYRLCSSYDI